MDYYDSLDNDPLSISIDKAIEKNILESKILTMFHSTDPSKDIKNSDELSEFGALMNKHRPNACLKGQNGEDLAYYIEERNRNAFLTNERGENLFNDKDYTEKLNKSLNNGEVYTNRPENLVLDKLDSETVRSFDSYVFDKRKEMLNQDSLEECIVPEECKPLVNMKEELASKVDAYKLSLDDPNQKFRYPQLLRSNLFRSMAEKFNKTNSCVESMPPVNPNKGVKSILQIAPVSNQERLYNQRKHEESKSLWVLAIVIVFS